MNPADRITCCRILFSPALLFLPPASVPFKILYLGCGISDLADGWVARKTHTESAKGAKLDSIADFLFLAVCAVKLLPLLHLPAWIWVWTAAIAVLKIAGLLRQRGIPTPPHSILNRITGLLLWLLPLTIPLGPVWHFAVPVCALATAAAIQDMRKREENDGNTDKTAASAGDDGGGF